MRFNEHSRLAGEHSFLSPSKPSWMNWSSDILEERYRTHRAAQRGTEEHALAAQMIRMGIKAYANKSTFSMYVNDAIRFGMTPEQTLYYSRNCFGTADAISFSRKKLRVHDLKTGVTKTSERQLFGYGALFCLEYMVNPFDISMEFRIYQSREARVYPGDPDEIVHIMEAIRHHDEHIRSIQMEEDL